MTCYSGISRDKNSLESKTHGNTSTPSTIKTLLVVQRAVTQWMSLKPAVFLTGNSVIFLRRILLRIIKLHLFLDLTCLTMMQQTPALWTSPLPSFSLTDDCDAALLGDLDHFVHQVLCPFCKVVPLEHADWTVPHDLLGSVHCFAVGLRALRSTVQSLWRRLWLQRDPVQIGGVEHPLLTIQPAGIPLATVAVPVVAFSSNLSAVTKSTGSVIFTPFFFALAIRSLTMLAPSSSYREVPI